MHLGSIFNEIEYAAPSCKWQHKSVFEDELQNTLIECHVIL
jgi:hypothetical protein